MIIQTLHEIVGTQVIDHMIPLAQEQMPPEWDVMPIQDQLEFIKKYQEFEMPYGIITKHSDLVETKVIKDYTF